MQQLLTACALDWLTMESRLKSMRWRQVGTQRTRPQLLLRRTDLTLPLAVHQVRSVGAAVCGDGSLRMGLRF